MNQWEKWGKQAEETPKWFAAKVIGGFVVLAVVITLIAGLLTTGNAFFQAGIAKTTAKPRVTQRAYGPENIEAQVYFFTQTCQDVSRDYANWKANQQNYERLREVSKSARTQGEAYEAEQQASSASTFIAGALEQLQTDAHSYDARSENYIANVSTVHEFESDGLPTTITVPASPTELLAWSPPSCG